MKGGVQASGERRWGPRERILRGGGEVLSDAELIAVVLGTGRRGMSAVELAQRLLFRIGGLGALRVSAPSSLRMAGIGEAKAASLLAVSALAQRLCRRAVPHRRPLREPSAVARYLSLRYEQPDQEVMGVLFLDTRHGLLGEEEMFRGTLDRAAVEPRQILRRALEMHAARVVLFHTHPSGDPSPSAEDLAFTRRMAGAGEVVGVNLVDHLILGSGGRWRSLRQEGGW